MKGKVTAIIQARMGSTRLPGKAMIDLGGKPLLYHVFERIQVTAGVDRIVLATCHGERNNGIIDLARSMGIDVFIGSEDNVLERFYCAARQFGGDFIMRVTGDNPFTDPGYAERTIRAIKETGADLCYFPNLPLGTGVGMVTKSALEIAYRRSDQPHEFEHVTPYIKEHPDEFKLHICDIELHNPFPNLRLTVDTEEDFEVARRVYAGCYRGKPFPLSEVISYIEKNPDIASINSAIQQRPMTHSSPTC
ncbi:MAG: glycosyltransferase family protein [Spirochaetes bacterium]|nr:glycosyltransferase family protein [Spirochaetota bacterium]